MITKTIIQLYNSFSLVRMFAFLFSSYGGIGVPGGNNGNLSDLVTTFSFHMSTPGYHQAVRGRTLGILYCTNYRARVYKEL